MLVQVLQDPICALFLIVRHYSIIVRRLFAGADNESRRQYFIAADSLSDIVLRCTKQTRALRHSCCEGCYQRERIAIGQRNVTTTPKDSQHSISKHHCAANGRKHMQCAPKLGQLLRIRASIQRTYLTKQQSAKSVISAGCCLIHSRRNDALGRCERGS